MLSMFVSSSVCFLNIIFGTFHTSHNVTQVVKHMLQALQR